MNGSLLAQRPNSPLISTNIKTDTLANDSIISENIQDTLSPPVLSSAPKFKISEEGFDAKVKYDAEDSTAINMIENKAYLYGNAVVVYETIELRADYIEIDLDSNIVLAKGRQDTLGNWTGLPQFKEKEQEFSAFEMRYNFKTQKGHITRVGTTQSGMNVKGAEAKLIRVKEDSTTKDIVYSKNATISTCDHDHPHFGIRSKKQKVIANKYVVVGPSNLEIMSVPTPLWLPFGFFPVQQGKSTGLIFPRDYESNSQLGFGLNNIGWYFPINDYVNLQLTGDVYTRGTYRLRGTMDYKKKYKYTGNVKLEFSSLKKENSLGFYERDPWAISLRVRHSQDAKAHPSRTIGGNISIETNNLSRNNYNDAFSQQNNSLSSNFSYSESFPGKPYRMSVTFRHSQNTQSRKMTIDFPTFDFVTQTLYPFERKQKVGGQKWYEKITLKYDMQAKAKLETRDDSLFTRESLEAIQYGANHKLSSNASFKIFKYFNINPNIRYRETWYFETLEKTFDPTTIELTEEITDPDTGELITVPSDTLFGVQSEAFIPGMRAARSLNASFGIDTKLFGTIQLKKGPLRGIRHTMTPRLSYSYKPDYTTDFWGYSKQVQIDNRRLDSLETYSIFQGGIYSAESITQGEESSVNFSIANNIEAKVFSRKDSTTNNIILIRGFNISGSHNFVLDSFNFSNISMSGNTNFFKNMSNWNFSSSWDPYRMDSEGNRVNELLWKSQKKPFRFSSGTLSINNKLSISNIRKLFNIEPKETSELPTAPTIVSLLERFTLTHQYQLRWNTQEGRIVRTVSSNRVSIIGKFDLTPMWQINVQSFGYDFVNKSTVYPAFNINRNLHCWEMGASWFPANESINFYIRVIPGSVFDFLNVPYKKGSAGGFRRF
jgi:lipopolysaccharide export system protein LptA